MVQSSFICFHSTFIYLLDYLFNLLCFTLLVYFRLVLLENYYFDFLLFSSQEVRRRNRYLAHLPLTCEFSICELVLQPPVLSKETLDTFAGVNSLNLSFPCGIKKYIHFYI